MDQTDSTNVLSTGAAVTRMPLRVLLVDDSEVDVELVIEELRHGGYEPTWERVDTAAALTAALDREQWDVITCDWVMPQFSGPAALALLQERQVDVPIIIVSGQVGEEYAVTAMKAGAHDFVSKQTLARLCPAIERELKETRVRWEHKQAGKALAVAHEQLRLITDNMLDMLSFVSADAVFQYVSPSHQRILGYAPEDLLGRNAFEFFHPEDVAPVTAAFAAGINGRTAGRVEFRHRHADGHYVWLEAVGRPFFDEHGSVAGVVVNGRDITERKQAREALRGSEERFRSLFGNSRDAIMTLEPPSWRFTSGNPTALKMFGAKNAEEFISCGPGELSPERQPDGRISAGKAKEMIETAVRQGSHFFEWTHRRIGGEEFPVNVLLTRMEQGGKVFLQATVRDLTERKRAEAAAYHWAAIVESSDDAIIGLTLDGVVTSWNPAAQKIYGYTAEEAIGQPMFLAIPAEQRGEARLILDRIRRGERVAHFETVRVRKDGRRFNISLTISPITDDHGVIVGASAIARDVTERKRAEAAIRTLNAELDQRVAERTAAVFATNEQLQREIIERKRMEETLRRSEAKFRLMFNSANDAMFILNLQGQFLEVNQVTCDRLQYTRDELLQMTVKDLDPPEFAARVGERIRQTLEDGYAVFETAHIRRDGVVIPVEVSARAIDYESEPAILSVVRDITERKQAENRIKRLNDDLKQRALKLESANKDLEAFSYSVSHDLRAPLRAVDGFSTMLLDRYGAQLDAQGRHYLQRVQEGAQRMGELINDLLVLSRITRSEMHSQVVDLSALARTIVTDLRKTQPERQVAFLIADDVVVDGDAGLLRAALENLLGNAWKYTSKHLAARIEFGVSHQDGQPVYFVRDDGVGFDMTYVGKLFGAFRRLHAADEFEGTGIGLATVQRIIHRHGGRVWAEGAVQQGATFYFTLPQSAVHYEDAPSEDEAPGRPPHQYP